MSVIHLLFFCEKKIININKMNVRINKFNFSFALKINEVEKSQRKIFIFPLHKTLWVTNINICAILHTILFIYFYFHQYINNKFWKTAFWHFSHFNCVFILFGIFYIFAFWSKQNQEYPRKSSKCVFLDIFLQKHDKIYFHLNIIKI